MSQEIQVRSREPEDVNDIAELLNQPRAIWGTLQTPFTSIDTRRQRMASLSSSHTNFVAVVEGKVIGTLGLTQMEGRRLHVGSIGMAVHDAYAGRGAGTALMSAAVQQAEKWLGIKRLELFVYDDNSRAIALYERFGFEREGLYRAYSWRDGAYVDAIAMARLTL